MKLEDYFLESIETENIKCNLKLNATLMDVHLNTDMYNESVYKTARNVFRSLKEVYKKFTDFFDITDMRKIYEEYESVVKLNAGKLDKDTKIEVIGQMDPFDAIVFTYELMVDNDVLESFYHSKSDFKSKWNTEWKKYNILDEEQVDSILADVLNGFNKYNPTNVVIGRGKSITDDIKKVYSYDTKRTVMLPEALDMIKRLGGLNFNEIHSKFVQAVALNRVMATTFEEIENDLEAWERRIDKDKDREFYEATKWRRVLVSYLYAFIASGAVEAYSSLKYTFKNIQSICSQIRLKIEGE